MLEAFIRRQGPQETAPHGPHEMAPQPAGVPAMAEGSPQPARVSQNHMKAKSSSQMEKDSLIQVEVQ